MLRSLSVCAQELLTSYRDFWQAARKLLKRRRAELQAEPPVDASVRPMEETPPFQRSWERSREAREEYESFVWPITELTELRRLLECRHIAPTWLLLGEFTRAQADELERRRGVVVLTVDRRQPLRPGLAYQGEFHEVVPLAFWDVVMAWPSCTHQALADEYCREAKALDGRMFWGIMSFIYCYSAAKAKAVFVEQPNVWIPVFYSAPYHRVEPAFYGDRVTKTINIFSRGITLPPFKTKERGDWSRKRFRDFADGEEADRWRSSWEHYTQMTACLARDMELHGSCVALSFAEEAQRFAEAWHDAGLPVPPDYLNPEGRPTSQADREYQLVRGLGDGRRLKGVNPRATPAIGSTIATASPSVDVLGPQHLVELAKLTEGAVILLLMSTMIQPLLYASLDGFRVLGAELPAQTARTGAPMALVRSWARSIGGTIAASTVFFAGRYTQGARVAVAPLDYLPPPGLIIRTPKQRRTACSAGLLMAWCTLTALAGTPLSDPASRAIVAVQSFVKPVSELADTVSLSHGSGLPSFTFGAMSAASMIRMPDIEVGLAPPRWILMRNEVRDAALITDALLEYRGEHAEYLQGWANLVQPPDLMDIPAEQLESLPSFEDRQLSDYPLTMPYVPPLTSWLPRRPPQPMRPGHCPTSASDLLLPHCLRRVEQWLERTTNHLKCTEAQEENCQELRPQPMAVGQACLRSWAKGIVWDFTFERSDCGVPLDVTLPVESHLNLEYLATELRDYPDQRLLSFLLEGVRFEADVELHSVFVPHLLSLAKGFGAVKKELYRLESLGWYKFFDRIPFWPIYFNGQGSTPRKLEPGRDRRTTEGGGPRKETFDEEGLRALSLNEATSVWHTPAYYSQDAALSAWAALCTLLRPPPDADGAQRKWPKEKKPTPTQVMNDIAVLRAAGHLLDEPVYLFGDDAKDYFNQLAMAPEAWPQLGIVFLMPNELEERIYSNEFTPKAGHIYFVSERRLGFGIRCSSGIAQRFSEALLSIFRRYMDEEEARIAASDTRPSFAEWRRRRASIPTPEDEPSLEWFKAQHRLYFVHMYTDDPIFGVVGVKRALAALRSWRRVTHGAGLIMAIAEKRSLGTWTLWLGILFFGGLGLAIVPKAKLLRATAGVNRALSGTMEFGDYRALMGLLEHLRCINCEGRYVMFGLYAPHSAEGVSRFGPNALVFLNGFMISQLMRWLALIARSGGASVLAALDKRHVRRPSGAIYTASADAATDSIPPGIGGYCHGMYWYIPLHPEWLNWLHITVLELLATGINAIVFAPYFTNAERVVLLSDALATPYALTRQKEKSPMLQLAHHALLADPQFQQVAKKAECAHLQGDCNPFADAISRAELERFQNLCKATGVKPKELPVPETAHRLLQRILELARERGEKVCRTPYVRRDPVIPPAMLHLERPLTDVEQGRGRQRRDNEDGDGPPPNEQPQDQNEGQFRVFVAGVGEVQGSFEPGLGVVRGSLPFLIRFVQQTGRAVNAGESIRPTTNLRQRVWTSERRWQTQDESEPDEDASFAFDSIGEPSPPWEVAQASTSKEAKQADVRASEEDEWTGRCTACANDQPLHSCDSCGCGLCKTCGIPAGMAPCTCRPQGATLPSTSSEVQLEAASLTTGSEGGAERLGDVAPLRPYYIATLRPRDEPSEPINLSWSRYWFPSYNYHRGVRGPCRRRKRRRLVGSDQLGVYYNSYSEWEDIPIINAPVPENPELRAAYRSRTLSAAEQGRGRTRRDNESGDGPPPRAIRLRGGAEPWQERWLCRLRGEAADVREGLQTGEQAPRQAAPEAELERFAARLRGAEPSSSSTSVAPTIPTTTIGNIRLPARPSAAQPASDSRLKAAAKLHAERRSQAMAQSPFAPALNVEALAHLLRHAEDMADFGAAYGTRRKDELAWERWELFAQAMGFDPLITSQQVRDYPEHVSALLAVFLMHVYARMKGKQGRAWAKPRSAFSYVLALIRIFRRWKVILPPAKCVKDELNGLLRAFVTIYGKAALQPRRREPLLFSMLEALCNISEGALLKRGLVWTRSRHDCRAFERMLKVGWRTGHRLAEMVWHPSGEIYYLTRADVTWVVGGVNVSDPTPAQLAQLKPGDCAILAPPRSKTDQFGEIHCPFPSTVLFDPSRPCNAGAALRDIELEQPCRGHLRATTPLFADNIGHPYRHGPMDDLLDAALLYCFGPAAAGTHSWHSLRSGLASALKAAGCPPDEIQLMCRWLNPESLRAYARLGTSRYISWVEAAEKAVVDAVQTANLPKYDLCEGFAGLQIEYGRALGPRAQAVLDAADDAAVADATPTRQLTPPPDLTPLTAENCVGRRVLVPAATWPQYRCDEHQGQGWSATVIRYNARHNAATVAFTDAVTARGIPYADVELRLDVLAPL